MRLIKKLVGCRFKVGDLVKFKEHHYRYIYRIEEIRFKNVWEVRTEDSPIWTDQERLELLYSRDKSHLYQKVRAWEAASKHLNKTIKNLLFN